MVYLQQVWYIIKMLAFIPIFPILYFQGKRVRATIPDLAEAVEPQGSVGEGPPTLSLLALGESTVAGIGVTYHREGLTGHLAASLSAEIGWEVDWQVIAKSGYTAKDVTEKLLPQIPDKDFDIIIVGLGGNDTFGLNSPLKWKIHLEQLIVELRKKYANEPIVFANLPPVGEFPAFTSLLQFIFHGVAMSFHQVLKGIARQHVNVWYSEELIAFEQWKDRLPADATIDTLFSDGVHPAPLTYQLWGEAITKFIIDKQIIQ